MSSLDAAFVAGSWLLALLWFVLAVDRERGRHPKPPTIEMPEPRRHLRVVK